MRYLPKCEFRKKLDDDGLSCGCNDLNQNITSQDEYIGVQVIILKSQRMRMRIRVEWRKRVDRCWCWMMSVCVWIMFLLTVISDTLDILCCMMHQLPVSVWVSAVGWIVGDGACRWKNRQCSTIRDRWRKMKILSKRTIELNQKRFQNGGWQHGILSVHCFHWFTLLVWRKQETPKILFPQHSEKVPSTKG